jgi:hypothetical protein
VAGSRERRVRAVAREHRPASGAALVHFLCTMLSLYEMWLAARTQTCMCSHARTQTCARCVPRVICSGAMLLLLCTMWLAAENGVYVRPLVNTDLLRVCLVRVSGRHNVAAVYSVAGSRERRVCATTREHRPASGRCACVNRNTTCCSFQPPQEWLCLFDTLPKEWMEDTQLAPDS